MSLETIKKKILSSKSSASTSQVPLCAKQNYTNKLSCTLI